MANWAEFEMEGQEKPAACAVCEAMLPDAVDGALTAAEQRVFDAHVAGCVVCARELEEAQRGAAWLSMLKTQTPEPPASLLTKILAETTGVAAAGGTEVVASPIVSDRIAQEWGTQPVEGVRSREWGARWMAFRGKVVEAFSFESSRMAFQPRLAMTAAMAFFSIALTLNLTGVKLRDLRAENFTPSGMRRSVADMGASATRSFQNLRVVYQVESRVSELRDDERPGHGRESSVGGATYGLSQQDNTQPSQSQEQQPKTDGSQSNQPQSNEQQNKDDQPKKTPKPQGSSDLVLPLPERVVRGSLTARKEV